MTAQLNYTPASRNPYVDLISDQSFAVIDSLTLDSGDVLKKVDVAYKTWGLLNENKDNVLVICHALSGSSDVSDWWEPLLRPGKAFDFTRYFVFCGNLLGSPYGSASPLTINPRTGERYGPSFPDTSIRDDVRAHKLVLDALGVHSIAAVVGGSMGGMATIEWPLCTPPGYVKNIIPIATSADHCAWGISWAETQKQCIYADANFHDGHYDIHKQPAAGLAAARMIAMLTYRSCVSFDRRFGRKPPPKKNAHAPQNSLDFTPVGGAKDGVKQDPRCDAFRSAKRARVEATNGMQTPVHRTRSPQFSAQGYLNYQGEKFIKRFDANCYICLTNKMDTHDVTRDRLEHGEVPNDEDFRQILQAVPPRALVVGVDTDNLFQPEQQARLASYMPDATLASLDSPDGHDGFLLAFEELNDLITERLKEQCAWLYEGEPLLNENQVAAAITVQDSIFGEVESQW